MLFLRRYSAVRKKRGENHNDNGLLFMRKNGATNSQTRDNIDKFIAHTTVLNAIRHFLLVTQRAGGFIEDNRWCIIG